MFTDSHGMNRWKTVANVQCPVSIYSSASAGTLVQNVDYVRIESVTLDWYSPSLRAPNKTGCGIV
jgi:hypothetical protein